MLIKLDDAIAAVENIVPEWARKGSMAKFNTVTIGQAEAALRALPTVSDGWEDIAKALRRQTENMAFLLNHMTILPQWYDKFTKELEEDRGALGPLPAPPSE